MKKITRHLNRMITVLLIVSILLGSAVFLGSCSESRTADSNTTDEITIPQNTEITASVGKSYANSFEYTIAGSDFDMVNILRNGEVVSYEAGAINGLNKFEFSPNVQFTRGDEITIKCYKQNVLVASGEGVYNYEDNNSVQNSVPSENVPNDDIVDNNESNDNINIFNKPNNNTSAEDVYSDNKAPALTVTTPAETSSNNPTRATNSTYTVAGKAFDSESGIKSVTVNGASATVRSDGSWSINIALPINNVRTVTVVATDNAWNSVTAIRYIEYREAPKTNTETAYALVLDNSYYDKQDYRPLIFVTSDVEIIAGKEYDSETYGKREVLAAYTGFDTTSYSSESEVPWNGYSITSVIFEDEIVPNSTAYWFYGLKKCYNWNLDALNTYRVIDMSYMFCKAGYDIDLLTVDLDLSKLNTSSVNNMDFMFYQTGYDSSVVRIDLSGWKTSAVNSMKSMFYQSGYKSDAFVLDLSDWDTSSVIDMSGLFRSAGYYADTCMINGISEWDTSAVEDMSYTFHRTGFAADVFEIDLSKWNTSSVVTMDNMFSYSGYRARVWSIGDLSGWDTSMVKDMSDMFHSAGREAERFEINVSSFDTSSVENMRKMFRYAGHDATTWSIGDLSGWDTSSVKDMGSMFASAGYNATVFEIKGLNRWNTSSVEDMNYMFSAAGYNAKTWSLGDISDWDVSGVKDMSFMFESAGCNASKWTVGDLSKWNVSSVKYMKRMFYFAGLNADYSLDLSVWDVSNVTEHAEFNTKVEKKVISPFI